MKTTLAAFLYIALSLSALAQTLTPEQLKTDFTRFRTALNEVHPEMYRYTSKTKFDSLFEVTYAQLNRSMTQHEFYVTMVPLLTALRDGHIKWIVSGRDEHYPFSTDKLFPLKLYFLNNKAWVVGNYGPSHVPDGVELVSINGQSIATIIQKLFPNMTFADGDRIGGKYEDLNRYFSGYYATFIGAPNAFEIVYKTGSEEKTVTVSSIAEKTIKDYVEAHKPAAQKPFRLTFSDRQTAVMTIERFWSDEKEQDFHKFLKEAFLELKEKGAQNLVLDLRDNEGGEESWGVELYSYLAEKPFRYYDHISVRQKKKFSFPAWTSNLYKKLKWLAVKKRDNGYIMTMLPGLKTRKPKSDAFNGNVYVLINGNSFSVTTEFAARVHADKRATFIGQESGGGYKVNSSGIFTITQLPNSKIDLGIGTFGFNMANVPAEVREGQGIVPDYVVAPTADDIIKHHDPVMEYTLKLIQTQPTTLVKAK